MKKSNAFAIIGVAGYVAPRHMAAIRENGGTLRAAMDLSDSVGVLDSYFPEAEFFTEFERFERFVYKQNKIGQKIDYISICSPNYLHDSHCRFALNACADAICEKPLVLSPHNLDRLCDAEKETGRQINCILQLRLHPEVIRLKEFVAASPNKHFEMNLRYITSRGKWYGVSWKGNDEKSGGILFNIGIHFFDMLIFIFGPPKNAHMDTFEFNSAGGNIQFDHANVNWFLSTDANDLPQNHSSATYRSLTVDGDEFEFSAGFADLHSLSYKSILDRKGFRLNDVRPSIELVSGLRNSIMNNF